MESLMEKNSTLSDSKKIKLQTSLLFFLLFPFWGGCQNLELIKKIAINRPEAVSIDKHDQIYYAERNGTLIKLNKDGKFINSFSPQKLGTISLLEAWQSLRVFIFYRDFQEYLFLDRFLTPSTSYSFDGPEIGFVRSATISNDNNIWMVDETDFSLKKLDIRFQKIVINSPLDLILNPEDYDIGFLKVYQNQLFIGDRISGILIFDNLGNYNKTIPVTGIHHFGFINEKLYFLTDTGISFINIYTLEKDFIALDEEKTYLNVIATSRRLYLFSDLEIAIYSYYLN